MSVTISNLQNKKTKLISDAQAILTRGLKSIEDKATYDKILAEATEVQQHIDSLSYLERNLPSSAAPVVESPATKTPARASRSQRAAAYRNLFLKGIGGMSKEQRDLISTSDSEAIISQDFDKAYVEAQKFYGITATLVHQKKLDVAGKPTKFVDYDDTNSTMTYLPETTSTSGVEADPTISNTVPGTDSLVSLVKYSWQEAADAENFEDFIQRLVFVRAARGIEYALTLGKDSGSNTQLPNSPTGGILGQVSAGYTQSAGSLAAGPVYSQLTSLISSIDHAYYAAPNAGFMVGQSTFNYLISQVDSTGRPLYNFDPSTGLLMVAGKPVYVNGAMTAAYNTASSPVVLFGDFSRYYAYLNGGGLKVRILTQRYADQLSSAALSYVRLGSAVLVNDAVKALVTAAS